jgi:hypothetical protein
LAISREKKKVMEADLRRIRRGVKEAQMDGTWINGGGVGPPSAFVLSRAAKSNVQNVGAKPPLKTVRVSSADTATQQDSQLLLFTATETSLDFVAFVGGDDCLSVCLLLAPR